MNTNKTLLSIGISAIAAHQLIPILPSDLTWLPNAIEVALLCRMSAIGGRLNALNYLIGNYAEYFAALFDDKPVTMTKPVTYITTGYLQEGTPFHHIFPSGEVPLLSPLPCRPGENLPLSYAIDPDNLTGLQTEQLAHLLLQKNPHRTYEEVYLAVCLAIAIDARWFIGVFSPSCQ